MKTIQTQSLKQTRIQSSQTIKESLLVSLLLLLILLFPLVPSLYASDCSVDFDFNRPHADQHFDSDSRVYVRVDTDRSHDIDTMELFIDDQPIRTESRYPYEWSKSNSNKDSKLRHMQPGTYNLMVRVLDKCGDYHEKTRSFFVDANADAIDDVNIDAPVDSTTDDVSNDEGSDEGSDEDAVLDLIPFKIKVKTDNPGSSDDTQFSFPMVSTLGDNNQYSVDCDSDGQLEAIDTIGTFTCDYSVADEYIISIYASEPQIQFNISFDNLEDDDKGKVLNIEQWGNGKWRSMEGAFMGCWNLTSTALDTPDLSNVSSTRGMFYYAYNFNQYIGDWDVSNVTDMTGMFSGAHAFNQYIGRWDVSHVTQMGAMFHDAKAFNREIIDWDVSNVTDMSYMFAGAESFNQDIGNWNVANVRNMKAMFSIAEVFNQDIGNWQVANVTNMSTMFYIAEKFNQDISGWNVGNVTDMGHMFHFARAFNQNIGGWDVSNVTDMDYMFDYATAFNQTIGDWEVGSVNDMSHMFHDAKLFNQDITGWDVGNVTNMSGMFNRALQFDQDIGQWDVSNVTNMSGMLSEKPQFINYARMLIGWSRLPLQRDVTLGVDPRFSISSEGRFIINSARRAIFILKRDFGWTIDDSGEEPVNNPI